MFLLFAVWHGGGLLLALTNPSGRAHRISAAGIILNENRWLRCRRDFSLWAAILRVTVWDHLAGLDYNPIEAGGWDTFLSKSVYIYIGIVNAVWESIQISKSNLIGVILSSYFQKHLTWGADDMINLILERIYRELKICEMICMCRL